MIIKKLDIYLVFLLLFVAFFSSYKLFLDTYSFGLKNKYILVATITEHFNTVKLKRYGRFAWDDAYLNDKLTYDDQIYTHQGSTTQISLLNNSTIKLSEKTLFKIGKTENRTEFSLEKGMIHANFKFKKNKKIKIHLNKKIIELNTKDAEISIIESKGTSKISILKGFVTINQEGIIKQLNKDQFVKVNINDSKIKISHEEIIPIHPEMNMQKHFINNSKIKFKFRTSRKIKGSFLFHVARDSNFEYIYKSIRTNKQTLNINFSEPGIYYWRITHPLIKEYQIRQFKLIKILPPKIYLPPRDSIIRFKKVSSSINNTVKIIWQHSDHHSEIELFTPQNKKIKYQTQKSFHLVKINTVGEYAFRIRNIYSETMYSSWSKLHKFNVSQARAPYTPEILSPNDQHEYIFYNKNKMNIELRWKSPIGIPTSYKIIVSKVNKAIVNKVTSQNFEQIKLKSTGIFNWKVQMIDKWLRIGPFSQNRKFKVTLEELKNTLPQNGYTLRLARPDQKVDFKWSKVKKDKSYNFQISRTKDFKKIIHQQKTTKNKINITLKKLGTYYWRIQKRSDDANTSEYAEPVKVIIKPIPPPRKPILPHLKKLRIQIKKTSFFESILNFLIPTAHGAEFFTRIEWDGKENIKEYKLEIYTDANMDQLIIKKTTNNNKFDWKNPPIGIFYWRLAYTDYWDRTSEFSELSKLKLNIDNGLNILDKINLNSPTHNKKVIYSKNKMINFNWAIVKNALEYELTLSENLNFSSPFLSIKTKKTFLKIRHQKIKMKKFYWRIAAFGPYNSNRISKRRSLAIFSPRKIKRRKTKLSIKQKNKKNYILTGIAPSKDIYEITSSSFVSEINGKSTLSIFSRGLYHYQKYLLNYDLFLKNGKVYSDQTWKIIDFYPSFSYPIKNFWIDGGVNLSQIGVYNYTLGNSSPTYSGKFLFSPFISLKYNTNLSPSLLLNLKAGKGFMGTSPIFIDAIIIYNYSKKTLVSAGINYSKKSFENEDQDINITEMKIILGLGFKF